MKTQFRAYAEDELPNIEFRSTGDEALIDAIGRATAERSLDGKYAAIIVEEVREATLSDFFDFDQLVSLMRESMQELIGNDDAFTEEAMAALRPWASAAIDDALDTAAEHADLRIDGFIVVSRQRAERWWIKAGDDE